MESLPRHSRLHGGCTGGAERQVALGITIPKGYSEATASDSGSIWVTGGLDVNIL